MADVTLFKCTRERERKKKEPRDFTLHSSCKAFAAAKDINGLLLEMKWFDTHTAAD